MTRGFGGFVHLLVAVCGCGAACRAGTVPGFKYVFFLSANHDENQNINSIKK